MRTQNKVTVRLPKGLFIPDPVLVSLLSTKKPMRSIAVFVLLAKSKMQVKGESVVERVAETLVTSPEKVNETMTDLEKAGLLRNLNGNLFLAMPIVVRKKKQKLEKVNPKYVRLVQDFLKAYASHHNDTVARRRVKDMNHCERESRAVEYLVRLGWSASQLHDILHWVIKDTFWFQYIHTVSALKKMKNGVMRIEHISGEMKRKGHHEIGDYPSIMDDTIEKFHRVSTKDKSALYDTYRKLRKYYNTRQGIRGAATRTEAKFYLFYQSPLVFLQTYMDYVAKKGWADMPISSIAIPDGRLWQNFIRAEESGCGLTFKEAK